MFVPVQVGRAAVLASALFAAGAASGEAVTYTGGGSYVSDQELMPLASGDAVVLGTAQGTFAISTEPPSVMDLRCSGMGIAKADGEVGSVLYCAFTDPVDPEHGFDIKGIERGDAVDVEIVGGSGRWAGASGSGTMQRVKQWSNGGSVTFEFAIATP